MPGELEVGGGRREAGDPTTRTRPRGGGNMYRQTLDPASTPGPYLDPSLFLFQSGRKVGHYPPGIDHEAATSLRGGGVLGEYSNVQRDEGGRWSTLETPQK